MGVRIGVLDCSIGGQNIKKNLLGLPGNSPGRSGGGARTTGRAKLLAGNVKFPGYSMYIQRNHRTGHYRSTSKVFSRRHFQERGIFRDIGEF